MQIRHTLIIWLSIWCLGLSACTQPPPVLTGPGVTRYQVVPSGSMVKEARPVADFNRVAFVGLGILQIAQTGEESLVIEADAALLPHIQVEVRDQQLFIGMSPGYVMTSDQPITMSVHVKTLREVTLEGKTDTTINDLQSAKLQLNLRGDHNVEVSGQVEEQNVQIAGVGMYQARDLLSRGTQIRIDGAGSAMVTTSQHLDVTINGTGQVVYAGSPSVVRQLNGEADVCSANDCMFLPTTYIRSILTALLDK